MPRAACRAVLECCQLLRAVPSDIGTFFAATEFRKRFNTDARRIDMFVTLRGGGVQGGACSRARVGRASYVEGRAT
jgi:hypothetical protein